MAATIHERYYWAVEVLDIKKADNILEIGCGTGIAATLVAEQLTTGQITAIDRSAAVIDKARKKNASYIEAGTARFEVASIEDVPAPKLLYDKIFAFNVSLFWKKPNIELQKVASLLKPGGTLYIFHQPPYEITKEIAEQTKQEIEKRGFKVIDILYKDSKPASVSCVVAGRDALKDHIEDRSSRINRVLAFTP